MGITGDWLFFEVPLKTIPILPPTVKFFGIMNSGRGPNTPSDPLATQGASKPLENAADIFGSLGNLNLNSLIVTRESAPNTSLEVSFANAIDTIYFWERGGNAGSSIYGDSDILVEALDDSGNAIAGYKILRKNYTPGGAATSAPVSIVPIPWTHPC